jgi:hypothetical protein
VKNYPKPEGRWTGVTFQVRHSPKHTAEITMPDDYETCINELASEMAGYAGGLPEEQWSFVFHPAKRRKGKQMKLYESE